MRAIVAAAALAICAAGPAAAQNALGANFNEHFEDVDYRDLEKGSAKWLRLFVPMQQLDRADKPGAVRTILDAGGRGYKTILSLKWPYPRKDFPKAGTPQFAAEIARLEKLLPQVMGLVDILVIGNEPYIESREGDRDLDLNDFYEAMATHIIAYRTAHCSENCKTRLYMGALNRLDLKRNITASTDRWMAYVKETPELDGVDIHPHIPVIAASKPFLDYVLPRMRPEQKFLVTEFSIVWWWRDNMTKPISPVFAEKYKVPKTAQNWQIVKAALDEPFAKQHWDDFLAMSPWFETRRHYLRNQMKIFRDTGRLAVATYGYRQGSSMAAEWGPEKTPWLLNSVFAARTVRPNPDGSAQPNYAWIDDFRALQTEN